MTSHYSERWLAFEIGARPGRLTQLAYTVDDHYQTSERKIGEKLRVISNPSDELKLVQRRLRRRFLASLPLPQHVHGCVAGRSALTNASCHVGQPSLASVDIKDFYPSVTTEMVYDVWEQRVGLTPNLASLVTRLTTLDFGLPQGSPTSDALANQVVWSIDEGLITVVKALELRPSRYLDNIDASGLRSREAIGPIIELIRSAGFAVRHRKVFNLGGSTARVVTGLVTNSKVTPTSGRRRIDFVRSMVHHFPTTTDKSAVQLEERRIRGHIAYLQRTNAGAAERLLRKLTRQAAHH